MVPENVSNNEDVIDSRDVIARIKELEEEIEAAKEDNTDVSEQEAELAPLKALADEGDRFPDWNHGATLIHDSYFEDYARQTAEDIGAVSDLDTWPATCIDWEKAASELQMDYSSIDFDGETYWIRC